jgi:hypothetical protein
MPSLPTPGGDANVWGTELNTWLLVAHNPDGTGIGGGGGVSSVNTRTGAVTLTAADVAGGASGTSGQLLQTNGSGVGSWVNAPQYPNPHAYFLTPLGSGADDTPQIKTTINNAVSAAISRGDNYAEIWLAPGVYQIKGALVQGGTTHGNSQIPLPIVAMTSQQKVVLSIRSYTDGTSLPIWNQTVAQQSGACLYSSGITGSYSSAYGMPSILGGPTPEGGYGNESSGNLWDNMNLILDGISVSQALNPTLVGFDLRGVAQCRIGTLGAFVNAPTATVASTYPSNTSGWGLALPKQGNNDYCLIDSYACEGYNIGLLFEEHLAMTRCAIVSCGSGLVAYTSVGGGGHFNWIGYASVENCGYNLDCQASGGNVGIVIDCLDIENPTAGSVFLGGYHIKDPLGYLYGTIGIAGSGPGLSAPITALGTFPVVQSSGTNVPLNCRVINLSRNQGIYDTSDGMTVPASGTPYVNPFYRDAMVYVHGGTVTAIGINGANGSSHTIPSTTSGPIWVPACTAIVLTYSVAPTGWTWQVT